MHQLTRPSLHHSCTILSAQATLLLQLLLLLLSSHAAVVLLLSHRSPRVIMADG